MIDKNFEIESLKHIENMSLCLEQVETHNRKRSRNRESKGSGKWLKNQRNRKIRRVDQTEVPNIKYEGWEY